MRDTGAGTTTGVAGVRARVSVVVLAKTPLPGRVKTRLCPPFTPEQAALLAAASLRDTLHAVTSVRAAACVLALDGPPGQWARPGLAVRPQRDGSLDRRLTAAVADAWERHGLPVLVIGGDTPQVTGSLLDLAVTRLLSAGVDAVLGPASDGGFWALGLRRPAPRATLGVPMSTAGTGDVQLARLRRAGLQVALLPQLRDVDTADDAAAVAALAPCTRFARGYAALAGVAARAADSYAGEEGVA